MKAPTAKTVVYAEHERVHLVQNKSQAIGEFLEWLQGEKGFTICELRRRSDTYVPVNLNTEKILADFFEIDLDKLEREKRQMIADLRIGYATKEINTELGL